jgi:hypothetical protein
MIVCWCGYANLIYSARMDKASRTKKSDLSGMPFFQAELLLYEQLQGLIAGRFYAAYVKEKQKKLHPGREVRYSLQHFVLFCFVAAAQGIIGNASFAAVSELLKRMRQPKAELLPTKATFEAVVSRDTYNRIRRERYPGNRADRDIDPDTQEFIEKTYRLTVAVRKTVTRKKSSRTK